MSNPFIIEGCINDPAVRAEIAEEAEGELADGDALIHESVLLDEWDVCYIKGCGIFICGSGTYALLEKEARRIEEDRG